MSTETLRGDPDFRRYLLARVISVAGTLVSLVALPVLVYQLTGSAAWTSAVAATEALPYLLFGLFAGALADRVNRRKLMVAADLISSALLASVPIAWAADILTAPHVLVVAFLAQTMFVFFDAANFGALPALVGRERTTAAFSAAFGATTVVEIAVPPLAALAVTMTVPAPLIALDALTYVASAMLIRAIVRPLSTSDRGRPRSGREVLVDVRGGLSFLWQNKIVRTLTLVGATHSAVGGAWIAMQLPWADRILGVAPSGDARLAVLLSCFAVGGLIASRLAPRLTEKLGAARLALLALPTSLGTGLLVTATSHWLVATFAIILWGTAFTTVVINGITYRQQVTPDELQGRVNTTARMLAWGVGHPGGAALAGAVAVWADPRIGLASTLVVLAVGVIVAWCSPLRTEAKKKLQSTAS
ncbi:MFS transporter [Allokutzneria sp. A3M-2-11 16]|nr:MFS transporter [Allokutzneria sp. A3M-2-11 16]MCP3799703.1 MFS transporter [Allokutzneria sp. A3M-2-11 16]